MIRARVMAATRDIAATQSCTVLFIEDDPDDIFLFERAFAQSKIPCQVHTVRTVEEGIAYIRGQEPFIDRKAFPLPNLIITDLGFRGDSGLHFLNWVRYES